MTGTRRVILQVVLAGVLLATMGLAALTMRSVEAAMEVELSAPQEVVTLRLRLPEGWEYDADVHEQVAAIFGSTPRDQVPRRWLEVHHYANPEGLDPEDYLNVRGVVPPVYPRDLTARSPVARLRWAGSATVAGVRGIMLEGYRVAPDRDAQYHDLFICGRAGREIILVKLQSMRSDPGFGDRVLARQIAKSIEIVHPLSQ